MDWLLMILWWFSGTDNETIRACAPRDRRHRTALGLVFILNYVVLIVVWVKVGIRYFGWGGFIPGLLVPSVFLALDRIFAMRHRRLTGELAVYDTGRVDSKAEVRLRIAIALALSLATTFTFQMDRAGSLIRERMQVQWEAANSQLREEIATQVKTEYAKKKAYFQQYMKPLQEQRTNANNLLVEAQRAEQESSDKTRLAREEQLREEGGLDGRPAGRGRKFYAQQGLTELHEGIAAEVKSRQQAIIAVIEGLDKQLSGIADSLRDLDKSETDQLAKMDTLMQQDSRYVPKKNIELFSDAAIFVGLFFDPEVALGMWLLSLLMWVSLLVMELAALIAISILPPSSYDIALIAGLRVDAARFVKAAETRLAQGDADSPPIQVHPRQGNQRANQGTRPIGGLNHDHEQI
jgi:hypothetical protein